MRKFLKGLLLTGVVIVALLILIRLVGSPLATHWVNNKLSSMPQFTGHVDSVQLALWRGTVTVRDLQLSDREHPEDGAIVIVPHGMLSLAWAPIFHGRVGGEGSVDHAKIIMVKRAETAQDEKEKAKKLSKPMVRAWQDVLARQFPIELRKIEVKDAQLRFDDRSDPQVVSLTIDQIDLTLAGFSNRKKGQEALPATLKMNARMGGTGGMVLEAKADPAESMPRFEVKLEIKRLELPPLHDFLVRYALVDVSSGEFELYTEVSAANGTYSGYTKPFFKELKFKAVPDPEKSTLQRTATKVAAAVGNLLKNDRGEVATKAPFHGNFADNKIDVWVTVENLLRNAFIQALREGLEGQTASS